MTYLLLAKVFISSKTVKLKKNQKFYPVFNKEAKSAPAIYTYLYVREKTPIRDENQNKKQFNKVKAKSMIF